MLKEPFVWAVAQPKDLVVGLMALSEIAPSAGNDGSDSRLADSLKYCLCHGCCIVQYNTSESDVDGPGARFEKGGKILWWGVRLWLSKEKAANI